MGKRALLAVQVDASDAMLLGHQPDRQMHGRGRLAGPAFVIPDRDEIGPVRARKGFGGVLVVQLQAALAERHCDPPDLYHTRAGIRPVGPGHGAGDTQEEARPVAIAIDASYGFQRPGAALLRMCQDILGEDSKEVGRIVHIVRLQRLDAGQQVVEAAALRETHVAIGRGDQRRSGHGGIEKRTITRAPGGTQQGVRQLVEQAHSYTELEIERPFDAADPSPFTNAPWVGASIAFLA